MEDLDYVLNTSAVCQGPFSNPHLSFIALRCRRLESSHDSLSLWRRSFKKMHGVHTIVNCKMQQGTCEKRSAANDVSSFHSHTLFPLREETDRGHVSAPHRPEPHRGGHRRDEQEGGWDQTALLVQWGWHDPPAAQTAGQHQCPGACLFFLTCAHKIRWNVSPRTSNMAPLHPPPRLMLDHSPMPELFWMIQAPKNIPITRSSSWKRSSGGILAAQGVCVIDFSSFPFNKPWLFFIFVVQELCGGLWPWLRH